MGMQINTNIAALNTYRNLSTNQNSLNSSLEKLSSGLRINRAADDAAGLVISEGLKSQIGGLTVAARNAQDGVSVVQTAEGALGQAQSILQRLRDLAVQAGNDSNSSDARTALQNEATSLTSELTRISKSTNFNGKNLLDTAAAATTMKFQVGADGNADSQISVSMTDLSAIATNLAAPGATFTITNATAAGNYIVSNGKTQVTVDIGTAGTYTTSGAQGVADKLNSDTNFQNSFSASVDTTGKLLITSKNGGTVVGAGASAVIGTGGSTATAVAGTFDLTSANGAQAAIKSIDNQLDTVSTARSALGAVQNRFDRAIANINVAIENLSASKSRITDVDMASEMVNFTRSQILSQAGTAMLAQANQAPQLALKLLG